MNADDEALDRIRSADPARAAATDLTSLRRAVDLRIEGGKTGGDDVDGDELIRDDLAARRARRSRRSAWLAGAAASVIVGTGGYLAGLSSGGSGADSAGGFDQAEPELATAQDGAGSAELEDSAGGEAVENSGPAAPDDAGMAEDSSFAAWGRAVFVASGLSEAESGAEAFAYDATGIDPAATVAELAGSLGIDGSPVDEGGYWVVRDSDGRSVEVHADGTASVSYSDPSLDPWACAVQGSDVSDPDSGVDGGGTDGFSGCPDDGASPADPLGTARSFLTDLGVDLTGLELVVEEGGRGVTGVSAYAPGTTGTSGPVWNLMVGIDGVYTAWGWLAPTVSLGSYDVVSPVAAVERLMDPRFGAGYGIQPYAVDGPTVLDGDTSVSSEPGSPSAPLAPGSDIPWPVQTYTITGADLVLSVYSLPDGSVVLLPTWSLTSDDGLAWTVLALTDDALDFDAAG